MHRVAIAVDGKLSFKPSPAMGMVTRFGYLARPDLDAGARRRVDAALDGGRFRRPLGALYVQADETLTETRGLHGTLSADGGVGRWALPAAGVLAFFGLYGLYRRLTPRALAERKDQALDAEIARLG